MASKPSLSQEVHDRIHFDTLLEQAEQMVRDYASETWSDLAEHDPGMTLLQALSYGVSDLAYRHTLPLVDLLTPEFEKEAIFSKQFAPEHMLTSGPITQDDYRRALLDLHSSDDAENRDKYSHHDFYFRNVQLTPEPEKKRYRYWHNSETRELLLIGPANKSDDPAEGDVEERVVLGGFNLYVELNFGLALKDWDTQPGKLPLAKHEDLKALAEPVLKQFLQEHRNLCEEVREIIWVKPHTESLFRADIELEDDCQNPEEVMAQILIKAQTMACPVAQHLTVKELTELGQNNGAIYQGPRLLHGWIPTLPLERDYSQEFKITISPLVNQLLEIDGIKRIQKLGFGTAVDSADVTWDCTIPHNQGTGKDTHQYPQIWQGKTFNTNEDIEALSKQVVLLKRGQRVEPKAQEILKHIESRRPPLINPQNTPPLRGRWRKPGVYHKASQQLPPCYGLQEPNPNSKQTQLRQFLLPFEQQLANGCDQLALLPALLSFERGGENDDSDARVWGSHLEFLKSEKDNNSELIKSLEAKAQDPVKERAIINYLLGYFGTRPISKVLLKEDNPQNFLSIQRGYLAQQGELGYGRASIQVNAVSALQRRIAARLGVGAKLFKKIPDKPTDRLNYLSHLPFYVVEHRALLPKQHPAGKNGEPKWEEVSKITTRDARLEMAVSTDFKKEDYINLAVDKQFFIGIKIESVNDKEVAVNLNDHAQLEAYIRKTKKKNINELVSSKKAKLQKCNDVAGITLSDDREKLIIILKEEQKKLGFEVGQLIDLQIKSYTIFRLNICEVNDNKNEIVFKLSDSIELHNIIDSVGEIKKEDVHLHKSIVWLKDKSHEIRFISLEKKEWIISDTCPLPLKPGDKIDIFSKDKMEYRSTEEVELIDLAINSFKLKSGASKVRADRDIYYFNKNEIKDRFTFTLSVVFNKKWLEGVKDPDTTMEWVKKIVSEEVPSHLSAQIHWLEYGQFLQFGEAYGKWQNGGAPAWGESSYQLLSYLSLGELPAPVKGIGMMMIASKNDGKRKEYIGPNEESTSNWDDEKVKETGLFYVPKGSETKVPPSSTS